MLLFNRISLWAQRMRNSRSTYEPTPSQIPQPMPGAFPQEESDVASSRGLSPVNTSTTYRDLVWKMCTHILAGLTLIFMLAIQVFVVMVKIIYKVLLFITATSQNATYTAIDPIDKVNKFVLQLEENLPTQQSSGGNSLPPFFQGSYTQALFMATQRARFLFVYLTNPNNESSSSLFRKIITNPEFISLCLQDQMVIWAGDLTNSEAYQLANSLNVTKFPFLGLMCLTRKTSMTSNGPVNSAPKITLILKIQGGLADDVDVSQLIDSKFRKRIEKHLEDLNAIKVDLRNQFMSKLLTEQQDLNYQRSLERDRAKKMAKQYDKLKKQYLAYRVDYFKQLQQNTQTSPGASFAKVAIKMPDGSRARMQFPADEPLEIIFEYVELLKLGYFDRHIEGPAMSEHEARSKFRGFELKYDFSLTSPVPPRVNLNSMRKSKIREVDLVYPNGLLFVESG